MLNRCWKQCALALMTASLSVSYFDRWLLALLVEPIKQDLAITDTQLGLLTGIGSSLLSVLLSVPIARWADRADRVKIAALTMGCWAAAVMAITATTTFAQLLLARMCASFGDAGVDPPLRSLVGDYYRGAKERTRAMFVLAASAPIASAVAFSCAGYLNEQIGWRLTFLCASIPGIVLALLLRFSLADPRARLAETNSPFAQTVPFRAVMNKVWRTPTCRRLGYAICLISVVGQGLTPWYGALITRVHQVGTGELGLWLGFTFGGGGALGLVAGMISFDRWFGGSDRRQLLAAALALLIAVPFVLLFLLLPNKALAISALLPFSLLSVIPVPPLVAQLQRLVPGGMRAAVIAIVFMVGNSIGIMIGPQLVGILSDLMQPRFGAASLRYAMLVVSLAYLIGAIQLYRAAKSVGSDMTCSSVDADMRMTDRSKLYTTPIEEQ